MLKILSYFYDVYKFPAYLFCFIFPYFHFCFFFVCPLFFSFFLNVYYKYTIKKYKTFLFLCQGKSFVSKEEYLRTKVVTVQIL